MTTPRRGSRTPLATLSVRIPLTQLRLLDARAAAADTTVSALVRELLREPTTTTRAQ